MQPSSTITLLFYFLENQVNSPEDEIRIQWHYLSQNKWICFKPAELEFDGTNGFHNLGIVKFFVPSHATDKNTILSSQYRWIRASVEKQAVRFPKLVKIWTQACTATWQDQKNTGTHLKKPLPPFTIDSSLNGLPEISSILQPFESFDGRQKETRNRMFIRTGERLRHKDRAILPWDYERLVLEQFLTIDKVKCLQTRSPKKGNVPGSVLVVVLPGPDNLDVTNPIEPKMSVKKLEEIKSFLLERISPFIDLYVVNPVYCRIEVSINVEFKESNDTGASIQKLNEELVLYLSPWFYSEERERKNGNYISESDISEFIQARPYVDFITTLSLKYSPDLQCTDQEWFFFTSAKKHRIKTVDERVCG